MQAEQCAAGAGKTHRNVALPPNLATTCQGARRDFQAGAADQAGADQRNFLVYSLAGLGLATLLAGGLGWGVSGRVLRPLRAITTAARTASQENLDQRLALDGPADELKELADTFDAMLARLDGAFASQRRFVANASHELRTPLTEMRTLIDVTLAKPARSAAQLEAVLAGVRVAVDRSEELIEALLTLARSDRGLGPTEVVDLPTAVEDAIEQASQAAAARQVQITTSLQPAQVTGDRVLIERLASNLIDNAVRHNVPGGWVIAATSHQAGIAELTVTSSGDPIPPGQVSGLFDPFRRLAGRAAACPAPGSACPSWPRSPKRTAAGPRHAPAQAAASKCRSRCQQPPRTAAHMAQSRPGRKPTRTRLTRSSQPERQRPASRCRPCGSDITRAEQEAGSHPAIR